MFDLQPTRHIPTPRIFTVAVPSSAGLLEPTTVIYTVIGDRYGGDWPRERFREHGIEYKVAEKPKSDLYRELLPVLNSNRCELLDHSRLIAQLCALERRTAQSSVTVSIIRRAVMMTLPMSLLGCRNRRGGGDH